ncbi:MAG: hypothetical protein V4736_14690 [Bdellovibrionota bacterium]
MMFPLMLTGLLTTILSLPAFSQNVSFRAYEFKTPELNTRSDLKKLFPDTTINVPQSALSNLIKFSLPPVNHTMDKDIYSLLQGIIDKNLPAATATSWCAELTTAAQLPAPTVSTACINQQNTFASALTNLTTACELVSNPQKFVLSQTPGAVIEDDLKNIEGMIKTIGEPLSHISYPSFITDAAVVNELKNIIRKMRFAPLNDGLEKAGTALTSAATAVTGGACFSTDDAKSQWSAKLEKISAATLNLKNKLAAMDNDGKTQAAADKKAAEASGRKRNALPYPSITDAERKLMTWFLGGVYWRMRGGGLIDYPPGTNETRRLYTEMIFRTLTVFNCGSECDGVAKSVGSAQKMALILKGWGEYMDIGHTAKEKDRFHDVAQMSKRGLYQVGSTVSLLDGKKYDTSAIKVAGAHMGSCYDLAWGKMMGIGVGEKLPLPYANFLGFPTEWGEFCIGAHLTKGLSETLLKGRL